MVVAGARVRGDWELLFISMEFQFYKMKNSKMGGSDETESIMRENQWSSASCMPNIGDWIAWKKLMYLM